MDNADARRHDLERIERLFAPFQEFVALAIAMKLEIEIAGERVTGPGVVHLNAVVDHQVHRHQRLDHFCIAAHAIHRRAHRGEIHQQRHTGEVLQNNPRHDKRDLVIAGVFGIVGGQIGNVLVADLKSIVIAQQAFENDPDRDRQTADARETVVRKRGQRMKFALNAGAGRECAKCVHGLVRKINETDQAADVPNAARGE